MSKILIVVDMQNDFITGSLIIPGAEKIVSVIARMLGKFDAVIYTQDWHPHNHCSFVEHGGRWPRHCVADSHGSAIHMGLPVRLGDVKFRSVQKGTRRDIESYSGFWDNNQSYETSLRDELNALVKEDEPMRLFFCGLATDFCVQYTVLDALKYYTDVIVLDDACRGVNERDAKAALDEMFNAGAMILPSTAVVASAGI